ncbi:TolB family protein [Clostridium sp. DL1XJH146]
MNMKNSKKNVHYNKFGNKKRLLFKQFVCEEKLEIPSQKPDVEEIISVIVNPEIVSLRVINTPKGTSYEGQYLSGKKVSIEIKLMQKIMYISKEVDQSVHVVENECYKSTYIVISDLIYGSKVEDLIKLEYITPKITLEGVFTEKIDDRTIYKNITLFIELKICTAYVLCYSEDYNCTKSKLYLSCDDGTNKKQIANFDNCKIYKPKWSSCGKKIAYICYRKHTSFLCVSDIYTKKVKKITEPYIFNRITSFSWGGNARKIYFSSYLKEKKEIFSVDINTYEWKQLTYSNRDCNNFKVRSSPDSKTVAYFKKIHDNTDIYTMNSNGLETKKITSSGNVKDFCWGNNNKDIAYVSLKDYGDREYGISASLKCKEKGDEIYIIDIVSFNRIDLDICDENLMIRNIKFSPNNRYIAFIGAKERYQNIYIYNLVKHIFISTNNDFNIKIADFDWNSESTKLYFSCNKLDYYNIFEFTIFDESVKQISNTFANNIKISYRTRII